MLSEFIFLGIISLIITIILAIKLECPEPEFLMWLWVVMFVIVLIIFGIVGAVVTPESYTEIEEIPLYKIYINGEVLNRYHYINDNGKVVVNKGKYQESLYDIAETIYGEGNKVVYVKIKYKDDIFPYNILPNIGCASFTDVILYLEE